MSNRSPLTVAERQAIYDGKSGGERLHDVAHRCHCSDSCARKWWRIGRKQGRDALACTSPRVATGALSRFEPIVAERALYWKRLHSKRGASRILADMADDQVLKGVRLPKSSALALFFHERCPELLQRREPRPKAPARSTHTHALWEVDGKENVRLGDGTIATVLDVREPWVCCFLGSFAHAVQTEKAWRKLDLREIQADLRQVFSTFGLPRALQTDRESVYGRPPEEQFPTLFTLWLVGLGVGHQFKRKERVTDQAHVERGHRTLFDWIEESQPLADLAVLQVALDTARLMHNTVLPSHAGDCDGRPPMAIHPEVKVPLRPYAPEAELALFDLKRVDNFLARYTWPHQVSKVGQVTVGPHAYGVGTAYAGKTVNVRFDPQDRCLTFHDVKDDHLIRRQPIQDLTVATITGIETLPPATGQPIQLSFPW
jgi:hypothetical protein